MYLVCMYVYINTNLHKKYLVQHNKHSYFNPIYAFKQYIKVFHRPRYANNALHSS